MISYALVKFLNVFGLMHLANKLKSFELVASDQVNDVGVNGHTLIILGFAVRVESDFGNEVPVREIVVDFKFVLEITEGRSGQVFQPKLLGNIHNVERQG